MPSPSHQQSNLQELQLDLQRRRGDLHRLQIPLEPNWSPQHRYASKLRNDFFEKFQPLHTQIYCKIGQAGDISTRMSKASNKPVANGICTVDHDDRNRFRFGQHQHERPHCFVRE